jgi:hypothetical protein
VALTLRILVVISSSSRIRQLSTSELFFCVLETATQREREIDDESCVQHVAHIPARPSKFSAHKPTVRYTLCYWVVYTHET